MRIYENENILLHININIYFASLPKSRFRDQHREGKKVRKGVRNKKENKG
jgi:hypothetical protein